VHTVKFNYYYDAKNHFNNRELTVDFKTGRIYTLSGAISQKFTRTEVTTRIVDNTPDVTDCFVTINGLDGFNGKYIIFYAKSEREDGATNAVGSKGLQKTNHLGIQIENGNAECQSLNFDDWHS